MRVSTVLIIILSSCPITVWLCMQKITNAPLNGFHCGGRNHTVNGNNAKGACTHACITSTECSSLSFNHVTETCVLSEVPCVTATRLNGFELMIFRDQQDVNCAVWVPDEPGVLDNNRLLYVKNNGVGRVSVNGDLLVGRADKPGQNWNTYIPQPSTDIQVWYRTQELLTVHPDCTMAWVPHTAGELQRGCLLTAGVYTPSELYFHRPIQCGVLVSILKGTLPAIMLTVEVIQSQILRFWSSSKLVDILFGRIFITLLRLYCIQRLKKHWWWNECIYILLNLITKLYNLSTEAI